MQDQTSGAAASACGELRPPHTMPASVGTVVKMALRAPLLHRVLSGRLMVIAVTGRKSGKVYEIPLSYTREGDVVTACTSVTNAWPKNLAGGASVRLLLRGVWAEGMAEPVVPGPGDLAWYLGRVPKDAKYHYVRLGKDGRADPGDLELAAREQLMIRVRVGSRPRAQSRS